MKETGKVQAEVMAEAEEYWSCWFLSCQDVSGPSHDEEFVLQECNIITTLGFET